MITLINPPGIKTFSGLQMHIIRRMAVLGVHDVAVSKFMPYPPSELFRRLQREGKIKLDDEFFVSPMDFYTAKAPSYAERVSIRRLYWTMLWLFVNFYVISFALRPWRVVRALVRAAFTGRRWRRLAGGAAR